MFTGLLAMVVTLAMPLTDENLEGQWCLTTVEEDGMLVERNEPWQFAPDGVIVVENMPPERIEGAYTINGDLIETSLALQLAVVALDERAMVARNGDVEYTFLRGECFE